ncbi:MAG: hypothetical protein L0287_37025, partial [Anaerolineae bacterium]|nr:hypothetical protein [Anaerolineae bacterium]
MDFLDGDGLPPREEFVRSHRTGDVHGTKVFLPILRAEHSEADDAETNPRIIADPILAHFCATLMPGFESKEIVANLIKIDGTQTRPITFLVRELNMHPIDFVMGGLDELKLRVRYFLLSCWKRNDPSDTTSASPCNILGPFPDIEQSDELLNEVGVELIPPATGRDTLSVFTYIEKAKLIRHLIHKNRAKNSLGTVRPEDIPLVNPTQLAKLDPLAGFELLAKRLRRIRDRLIGLISKTAALTGEIQRRHLILRGLHECRTAIQTIKEQLGSAGNNTAVENAVARLKGKVRNLIDTDPDFKRLAEAALIWIQIEQSISGDQDISKHVENLQAQFSGLERQFVVYIENAAKALVTNAHLPLLEISRFGLEKALSVFPDEPTEAAANKITKLCDQLLSSLSEKLQPLIADAQDLNNYVHCLKVVYLNAGEVNEVLHFNQDNQAAINEQLRNRLPLTEEQSRILSTVQFQNANYFEPLLHTLLDTISTLTLSPTYYEDFGLSAKIVLENDPEEIYNITKQQPLNVLENLINTYHITSRQAEIIAAFKLEDFDKFDESSIRERIVSITSNKLLEIISLLQTATDKEGMVILTPYLLAEDKDHGPEWTLEFSQLAALTGPTYLQEYRKIRPAIANLFELCAIGKELKAYEDKHYQRLDPEASTIKKHGNVDYLYLTSSIGSPVRVKCLTFLLVDQWQEGIPNPEASE